MAEQQQQSTGWPTPLPWNLGTLATDDDDAPTATHSWPPADWPTEAQLSYTRELITVLLLLLALPWLVSKLLTRPGDVLAGLGQHQVGKAAAG